MLTLTVVSVLRSEEPGSMMAIAIVSPWAHGGQLTLTVVSVLRSEEPGSRPDLRRFGSQYIFSHQDFFLTIVAHGAIVLT